jgi:hypothetical protein
MKTTGSGSAAWISVELSRFGGQVTTEVIRLPKHASSRRQPGSGARARNGGGAPTAVPAHQMSHLAIAPTPIFHGANGLRRRDLSGNAQVTPPAQVRVVTVR